MAPRSLAPCGASISGSIRGILGPNQPKSSLVSRCTVRCWKLAETSRPKVPSSFFQLYKPDNDGSVVSALSLYCPSMDTCEVLASRSNGLRVRRITVPPSAPSSKSAWEDLYTSRPATISEARISKLKLRVASDNTNHCAVPTAWPFSNVRFWSGCTPRMVTPWPSPKSRSMVIPGIRDNDSATFLSGNLPISSAVMASTTLSEKRLVLIFSFWLARIPRISITSVLSAPSCAKTAGVEVAATAPTASARRSPRVNLVILCFCITQALVLTIMTTLSFYS